SSSVSACCLKTRNRVFGYLQILLHIASFVEDSLKFADFLPLVFRNKKGLFLLVFPVERQCLFVHILLEGFLSQYFQFPESHQSPSPPHPHRVRSRQP